MKTRFCLRLALYMLWATLCLINVEAATKSKGKSKAKATPSSKEPTAPKLPPTESSKADSDKPADSAKTEHQPDAAKKNTDADKPTEGPKTEPRKAAVSTLATNELFGFYDYPAEVQRLIEDSLALTRRNLTYTFGSSDPKAGGMDCSGTIYYILQTQGLHSVPRQSDEMAAWVRDKSTLHLTPIAPSFDDAAFADLEPGDLLFWSGTYDTGARELPVSHVMIYLGKRKSDKKRVAFGASDGRYYKGESRCGVSVFDLSFPKAEGKASFYGYGAIPGLAKVRPREVIRKAQPTPTEAETKPAETIVTTSTKEKESSQPPAKAAIHTPTAPPRITTKEPQPSAKITEPIKSKAKPTVASTTDSEEVAKPKAKGETPTKKSTPSPKPTAKKTPSKETAPPAKSKVTPKPSPPSQPALKVPPGISRNAKRLVNGIRSLFD